MRVALDSIDVTTKERVALAHHLGTDHGVADRAEVRAWVDMLIRTTLAEIVDHYEGWEARFIEDQDDHGEPIQLDRCPSCDRPRGGRSSCPSCGRKGTP